MLPSNYVTPSKNTLNNTIKIRNNRQIGLDFDAKFSALKSHIKRDLENANAKTSFCKRLENALKIKDLLIKNLEFL